MKTTHTGRLLTIYRMVLGLNACLLTPPHTFCYAPNWYSFNEREKEKTLREKTRLKEAVMRSCFFDDSISMLRWKTLDTTVCVKAIRQHHKKKKKTLFLNLFWFDIYISLKYQSTSMCREILKVCLLVMSMGKNTGERLQSRTKSGEEDKNRGEPD